MQNLAYALIALAAGVLIPVMAALNGGLGRMLGNPIGAALIAVFVAFLGVLCAALLSGAAQPALWAPLRQATPAQLAAGLGMAVYIISITFLAPRFGVGNAVMFVVGGQIIAAAAIDHFGLLGAPRQPISGLRALGLVVMMAGVAIAQLAANAQHRA